MKKLITPIILSLAAAGAVAAPAIATAAPAAVVASGHVHPAFSYEG